MPVASLLVISCRFLGRERLGMTHGLERLETTTFDRRSQIDSADVCLVAPLPGSRRLHLDCKSRQLFVKGRAVSKLVAKIVRLYLGRESLEMTKYGRAGQTDSPDACPAAPFPESRRLHFDFKNCQKFVKGRAVSTLVAKIARLYLCREGLEMTKFVCAGQTDSADACPAAPFPEISKVARNLLRVAPFLRWSQKLPVSTSVVKVLK